MPMVFLDCSAGIAGDMLLGALIDLGAPVDVIRDGLGSLSLSESWSLDVTCVDRLGMTATRAHVTIQGKPSDSDHHQRHQHHHRHHSHQHRPDPSSSERSGDDHDAHHTHDHAPARPYRVIRDLIETSSLPERVKDRALSVFRELAVAEGAVHGVPPDEVHFHEVGSTDAIIDVVGSCLALEALGIDALEASPLHVGKGFVRAAHGRMPIPAPATLRLLEGMPIYQTDVTGELVTPTGAAMVRGLCRRVGPMTSLHLKRVGAGAGARDLPIPNAVRALLCTEAESDFERDEVIEFETNLDDMSPQLFGALFDTLLAAGALDVWVEAATMKKSRPGHILHVLAPEATEAVIARLILSETTSLGLRINRKSRWMLQREWMDVKVMDVSMRVKVGRLGDEIFNIAAEYEDAAAAALQLGIPVKRVIAAAERVAGAVLEEKE